MSYGYVYVAQIAMGANPNQALKAIKEAEAYDGPSLIIAYSPCINHGIKTGMCTAMAEMKKAVKAGYWNLYRYNPSAEAKGKNPLTIDSQEPSADYREFLMGEVRYSSLAQADSEHAEELFEKASAEASRRYEDLVRRKESFNSNK